MNSTDNADYRRHQASAGWAVAEIPVDSSARIDSDALDIGDDDALISVMLANNEVGTIQPIRAIAERARAAGALLHVDAAQAVGKIAVNVVELGCDLLTLAGHKFYAPKGVGALYVRSGTPIESIQFGAGHERGLRPGTENVPYIVALGTAARLAREEGTQESSRIRSLRDALHQRLASAIPGLLLNGHEEERLPNTLNLSFPFASGWELLANAKTLRLHRLRLPCRQSCDFRRAGGQGHRLDLSPSAPRREEKAVLRLHPSTGRADAGPLGWTRTWVSLTRAASTATRSRIRHCLAGLES